MTVVTGHDSEYRTEVTGQKSGYRAGLLLQGRTVLTVQECCHKKIQHHDQSTVVTGGHTTVKQDSKHRI